MQWPLVLALLALCTPAASFTLGSVARHAVAPRTSARMDVDKRKQAEGALERAQQRAKSYASEKRAKGVKDINPNTYNVLYSAIIALTLNDLRTNPQVVDWVAAGAALDEAPLQALGASSLLMAYALFQLLFSLGEAGTSAPFRFAVNRLGVTEPPAHAPSSSPVVDPSDTPGATAAESAAVAPARIGL